MSLALVFNSTHVSNTTNNTQFSYKFVNGSFEVPPDSTITLCNASIPYSFFNITAQYTNQVFQIKWVNAAVYTITLPAGFYSITDINNYLVSYCITNNLYLLDASGNYITYISLVYNTTYYAVQLNCFLVPISLPAGYTNPGAMPYASGAPATPQFYIPTTSNFGTIIGLLPTTYFPSAPSASNFSQLSTITPIGSTVNSIIVKCNLVDNDCTMPSDNMTSFPINCAFGSAITYGPTFGGRVYLKPGRYNQMSISLVDQNYNTIVANDRNVLLTFLITLGKKK